MGRIESPDIKSSIPLLIIGFVVIIALAVLFAAISLQANSKIAELNNKTYRHPFAVSNAVLKANASIIAMHRYMKDVVLATNQYELEKAIALVDIHEKEVFNDFVLIKERFLGDKETVNTAFTAFVDWELIRNEVMDLQRNNQPQKAAAITVGKGGEHVLLLTQKMNVLIEFAQNKALEFRRNSQTTYEQGQRSLCILLLFIIISSIATAFLVITRVRKAEKARKESESRFERLFKNSEISIWDEDFSSVIAALNSLKAEGVIDLKKHLQENRRLARELVAKVKVNNVNEATLKLFSANRTEELLANIGKIFTNDTIDVFIEELCAIWNGQEKFQSESSFKTMDGKGIKAIVTFQIPSQERDFHNIPVSVIDITTRKKAEEQLQLSSQVFSNTHEGIVITGVNKLILNVNPAFSDITGYSYNEVVGQNPSILNSGKQDSKFYSDMWLQINKNEYWQGEIWNRKKSGEEYAELLTISSLKNSKGDVVNYVGMFTDITHSKIQQDNLEKLAHYDALTTLPNRTLLIDRFNQAVAHAKRSNTLLAICFLDLDNFKPVNDILGHNMGDKLLIEVAHRLESIVRKEDTVSRLGGDEFSLLLANIKSTGECYELLERISSSISATYFIEEKSINISASVGVSLYPNDHVELDVLLRYADQAMYLVKQEGKKKFRFFDAKEANKIAQHHLELERIKEALTNHEFRLYYQPKVNMVSGKITGVEALIRWQHPDKGLVSPHDFLPILEGTELEIQVGDWVIDKGLSQLKLLNDQGVEIEVSVNVSSAQFLSSSFFADLNKALSRHGRVNSHLFQLEVLESSALGNLEQMNNVTRACRNELGVSIALDDFGTGYSSLSHLSKLSVDTIKIDQSFVRDVFDDPNDFAIIDGVIGLARSFNKNLIAEGVETLEHGLMLALMGCDNAQGYAISRPMPENELVGWIKSYIPSPVWSESACQNMTHQTRSTKQLVLVLNNWLKKIESILLSDRHEKSDMSHMGCHFDRWVGHLIQDPAFKETWFDELESAHAAMYSIAKELIEAHQAGNSPTKHELDQLHMAYKKMLVTLG